MTAVSPAPTIIGTPDVEVLRQDPQYRVYDGLLAFGLCACLVVGLPGNCLALYHFLQTKKRNLPTLLYRVACSVDICSSVIHLPVVVSLLKRRTEGLFQDPVNETFCFIWYLLLVLLQQISMFTVMLQSISRAIVIVQPFHKVNKKAVLASLPIYLLYHIAWTVVYFRFSTPFFSPGAGFCARYTSEEDHEVANILKSVYFANHSLCMGTPPAIVFLAFVISVVKLRKSQANSGTHSNKHKASVTITYFAAVFLFCNTLTFTNILLYVITVSLDHPNSNEFGSYPGKIYSNMFMFYYSWPISEIFCVVLNAALNPLLYLWRMEEMRQWLSQIVGIKEPREGRNSGIVCDDMTLPSSNVK